VEWVETTAKTVDEAKDEALDRLGVDEQDAEFEILEEPHPGLFGRMRGEGRADPRRVIIIGDTPRDVHCAKAHGCLCLAVATGGYSAQELRECGADVVLQDLSDPSLLLEMIG
jgi:phosphoglycolate phosphatase-like HAD superfamily hydrolase